MDQVNDKAHTLIEAFSRIRQLRDKTVVVSFNQGLIDDDDALHDALVDIHFMVTVGIRPVVIHGPGQCLNLALQEAGFDSRAKVRATPDNEAIIDIVERSLANELNRNLANEFEKIGGRAMTLNFESTPVLMGEKTIAVDNSEIDFDLIACGQVTRVDRRVIDNLCYAGQVPFIPAMCLTDTGQKLPVNPDSSAVVVADQMGAAILILFTELSAEMANQSDPNPRKHALSYLELDGLSGYLTRELPFVVNARGNELRLRTAQLIIADRRQRHSLLMKIFTSTGSGIERVEA